MLSLARMAAHRWYGRLLRWPLRLIPRGTRVRVLRGPLRGARWIVGSHTHGCWVGSYERERQQALVRLLRPGAVVYDLGANVGFFTLLAARLVGPGGLVVAFEPLPRNLAYLRRHVALNDCANVTVVDAAVADRAGPAALRTATTASAHLSPDGDVAVRTLTLDAVVFDQGLRPPTLLKLDIEGAELDALRGAGRVLEICRPVVVLSTHSAALRRECHGLLARAGYALEAEDGRALATDSDEVIAQSL